jgi:hypothetical protein
VRHQPAEASNSQKGHGTRCDRRRCGDGAEAWTSRAKKSTWARENDAKQPDALMSRECLRAAAWCLGQAVSGTDVFP